MRRQRIDEGAVFLQSIVEVRTSREAGRPDATDELALMHAGTGAHGDRREVQILRLEAVRVPQMDHPAGPAARSRGHDDAVRNRDDRRAGRRAVVDAEVRAILA